LPRFFKAGGETSDLEPYKRPIIVGFEGVLGGIRARVLVLEIGFSIIGFSLEK